MILVLLLSKRHILSMIWVADHTSLLPQHDAKLKDLSEQIDEVIQYIQKALHKPGKDIHAFSFELATALMVTYSS